METQLPFANNYEEAKNYLKGNEPFRLAETWIEFDSNQFVHKNESLSEEQMKIICDAFRYSNIEKCCLDQTILKFNTIRFDYLADLISHTSTIKHLSMLHFEFSRRNNVETISGALAKNSSIEIMDIFSDSISNHDEFFTFFIYGIIHNKSIRFVSFPAISRQSIQKIVPRLTNLISNPSCCLQGLDISSLFRDLKPEHINDTRDFWHALETNTSIHTLFVGGMAEKFHTLQMEEINRLLNFNFTLQRVARVDFGIPRDSSHEKEIRNKLERNRKRYLWRNSVNNYLSLRLLTCTIVDSFQFGYFPLDLIQEIISLLVEVQFTTQNFEHLPFFSFVDNYPRNSFEIH